MTPKPTGDPDLHLPAFAFDIPNLDTLRAVMVAEQKAGQEIARTVSTLSGNASAALVDPQGKPIPLAGGSIAEQVKALIHGLLARPLLSTAYAVGTDLVEGSQPTLVQFEPAGLKLAFLTYQGLGMLMMAHLGKRITEQLGNSIDMLTVFSLQAARNHRNPLMVLRKALRFQAKEATTGAVVAGEPAWADQLRSDLADLLLSFMIASGYAASELGPEETAAIVASGVPDLPSLSLTADGERLYLHLCDQVALKLTLQRRGPEITQEAAARGPETKTLEQVERELLNPTTPLHEA